MLSQNQTDAFVKAVSDCRRAAIVVHTHPDGDALGSEVALRRYLLSKGKEVSAIFPDSFPGTLSFLTEGEGLIDAEQDPSGAAKALQDCDTLFVLDMNAFRRAEAMESALKACPARSRVLIDHHLNPECGEFDLVFSRTDVSSASELLFWILLESEGGRMDAIPPKALYALMTGMTTDTNNFANSVYPSTLEMSSMLLAAGVDRDGIIASLYQNYSETRIRAFAAMLGERMEILPGGVALLLSDEVFQKRYPLGEGETEGLVNIPLGIAAVSMSIFARWNRDHFRVSIRSKRGRSANALAREFFHGGGHEMAAGGKVFVPADVPSQAGAAAHIAACVAQFLQKEDDR